MGIFAPPAAGSIVQVVSTNFAAVATGTTTIPADDTIPQITEGIEFMTQAITPKSTTNNLIILVEIMLSSSVAAQLSAALFQDATANALDANAQWQSQSGGLTTVVIAYTMAAGTISATTFRVRGGAHTAGTTTFNGSGGTRSFGAIAKSNITIWEVKV